MKKPPYFYSNDGNYLKYITVIPGINITENIIVVDSYIQQQLFIFASDDFFYISDDIRFLRSISNSDLSIHGLCQLAVFKANLYPYSIFDKIVPLPLCSKITVNGMKIQVERLEKKGDFSEEDLFSDFKNIVDEHIKDCGEIPYMMYSGGIDSSIIYSFINDKNVIMGSSIYEDEQYSDVMSASKFFNKTNICLEYLDTKRYLDILENYSVFNPYIDTGTVDDFIHCRNALEMGATSVTNGLGPDEAMGVALCGENEDLNNADYFFNKYSMFKLDILMEFFPVEVIYDVFEYTLENFDLGTLKGKIEYIVEYHQIPLQHGIIRNNYFLNEKIKRIQPFSTIDFYEKIMAMPDDLIYQNGIEKYILRKWAKEFLPKLIWAKKKKPFNMDNNRVVKEQIDRISSICESKFSDISFLFEKKDINILNILSRLDSMNKINLLMYLIVVKDFLRC